MKEEEDEKSIGLQDKQEKQKKGKMAEIDRRKKKRSSIRTAVTRLINKIDDKLVKERPDHDALEELLEQLILKEDYLTKMDLDVEEQTATEDIEDEVSRALEYKDHISLRKTRTRRALRRAKDDAESAMSVESNPMRNN